MEKKKALIISIIILTITGLIIYEAWTILSPVFVRTTSEYHYAFVPAKQVEIKLLCNTVHDCSVNVLNSTGDTINVTIRTTAPKTAEYKGTQKVAEAIGRNVTSSGDKNNLTLTIMLIGGDEMFQFVPSTASVEVQIPEGVNYSLTKVWPY
jgi:hypothetical protein